MFLIKKKDIKTTDVKKGKKGIMLSPSDKEYKELMRVILFGISIF